MEDTALLDSGEERYELDAPELGPKPVRSLLRRRSPLATPARQIAALDAIPLADRPFGGDFDVALRESGWSRLQPLSVEIFQINVGKLCNMTCRHCHVDAGPDRVREMMDRETVEACLQALDQTFRCRQHHRRSAGVVISTIVNIFTGNT